MPFNPLEQNQMMYPIKVEDSPFDLLPHLDTAFDRDSSFEYGGASASFPSSFFSSDVSSTDSQGRRRPSLASSMHSASPEALWTPSATSTSPTTPMLMDSGMQLGCRQYVKPTAYLTRSHSVFHPLQNEEQHSHGSFWDAPADAGLSLMGQSHDMMLAEASRPPYFDLQGLNHENANPSLTKSMFATPDLCALPEHEDAMLDWNSVAVEPPAQTIEPSVAFRSTLPSSPYYKLESPCYKFEPSTPLKTHLASSAILSSSPLSMMSPRVVPSEHDLDECQYLYLSLSLRESKKPRAAIDRMHKRAYGGKRIARSSSKPKSSPIKTGIDCPFVIEANDFACTYPECQKRFKRQEHKKRHEKTVHEKHEHTTYMCWVPECGTGFSRTDNLKSHLRNTHSKRPGVRGNRYVATLDKNSELYAPEWVGQLDKNGFPVKS